MDDPENRENLLIEIKMVKSQIMVQAYNNQWDTLKDFYQLSQGNDDGQFFDFFTKMIELMSDLCLDKNFVAINPLSKRFPYQMC